jgi:uncharacterized protein YbbC (DUF1343 family)
VSTKTGLDKVVEKEFAPLKGKSLGIVCNQVTVDSSFRHILEHAVAPQYKDSLQVKAAFGPQHGLWGHTQDNMIEWEGGTSTRFPFPIFSLYGIHREPTDEMLNGIDLLVVDLPDIGSRYYTFIWTMALCLKACERLGIPVTILDRPNPIGGIEVEGPVLDPEYASFVGLYPLPLRHGMTLGEIALYLQATYFPKVDLHVVKVEGWLRSQYLDETNVPWIMPSPNMPSLDTAILYPGGCLLEGTTLSEGRGTTRPFEIVGAPYIDGWSLCDRLNALSLQGVYFRPFQFQPTFQKHAGQICEGAYVHILDRKCLEPVKIYTAIIREIAHCYPQLFHWQSPPYEYEEIKLPIDILAGNEWLRKSILGYESLDLIADRAAEEVRNFSKTRANFLLYS